MAAQSGRAAGRRLLKAVGLACPDVPPAEALCEVLSGPIDWMYTLRAGADHCVLPLLERALAGAPDAAAMIPADVRQAVQIATLESAAGTQRQLAVLRTLLAAFEARGIPVLVLKGLTLAALYPAPHLRPADDIDLLVREEDWAAVVDALRGAGLQPLGRRAVAERLPAALVLHLACYVVEGQVQYAGPDRVLVEVHFRLVNKGLHGLREEAWERRRVQRVGAFDVPTISREDAIVTQAMHMNEHAFSRLIWFVDLALMLRGWRHAVDWDWIVRRARTLRVDLSLALAVDLLRRLGVELDGVPAPGEISRAGPMRRWWFNRWWCPAAILRFEHAPAFGRGSVSYYLNYRATWCDGFRYVFRGLWPPRACLGGESRRSYLRRFARHWDARLARALGLGDGARVRPGPA
jgi:hypothetical protein